MPDVIVQLAGVDQFAPFAAAFQTNVAPTGDSTVRLKLVVPARPSLSVPVIVTCWLGNPVVSTDQLQVPLTFWVTVPTEAVRATVSVGRSDHVPVFDATAPEFTILWPALANTGARLFTTRAKVVVPTPPSLSVAVRVTVWLLSGPSVVVNDQDHVPFAFFTTVPADAVKATVSAPTSDQVPLLAATWPSFTVTEAPPATTGTTLFTTSVKST